MTPVEKAYDEYRKKCLSLPVNTLGQKPPEPVSFRDFAHEWHIVVGAEVRARLNPSDKGKIQAGDCSKSRMDQVYPWDEEKAFLSETRFHSFLSDGKRPKPTLARYDARRDSGGMYKGKFGVWPNSDFGDE